MNKLSKSSVQNIQDEIFKKMSADEKVRLTFKIMNRIFTIAKTEMKLKYPRLNKLDFVHKLHRYLELNRARFDKLFNQILKKEILRHFSN